MVPRPLPSALLFGLVPIASWFVVRPLLDPVPSVPALYTSLGFSLYAFLGAMYLVPALGPKFIEARLSGKDLLKTYKTPMCADLLSLHGIADACMLLQTRKHGSRLCFDIYIGVDIVHPIRFLRLFDAFKEGA